MSKILYELGTDANPFLVFDNWRVLHGRSAFTGVRRICGGYSKCSFCVCLARLLEILLINAQSIAMTLSHDGEIRTTLEERSCAGLWVDTETNLRKYRTGRQ